MQGWPEKEKELGDEEGREKVQEKEFCSSAGWQVYVRAIYCQGQHFHHLSLSITSSPVIPILKSINKQQQELSEGNLLRFGKEMSC